MTRPRQQGLAHALAVLERLHDDAVKAYLRGRHAYHEGAADALDEAIRTLRGLESRERVDHDR